MKTNKKLNSTFKVIYVVVYTVGYTLAAASECVRTFGKSIRKIAPLEAQRKYEKRKNRKFG